jgi:hypothetical protein
MPLRNGAFFLIIGDLIRRDTMLTEKEINDVFLKWTDILRLKNSWDIKLELVRDPEFRKTGDIKIDCDDRKAILMLNQLDPKQENLEEVIVHELLHLKLYPLDQLTEGLIDSHYPKESPAYDAIYTQFMTMLEQTVEELTKCYLGAFGGNKELSYGRCRSQKSYNELYEGLKPL